MPQFKRPGFSQIVCSSRTVQDAFDLHRPTRCWWNLVLRLHGKPVDPLLTTVERITTIADGFDFYARLYRLLSVAFLLVASILFGLTALEGSDSWFYWAATSLLAGIYLWCVSGLGFAGAKAYRGNQTQGASCLVAFMVMIVVFLCMFVAVASVIAHHSAYLATIPNLAAASALFIFGVGSYLIEIVYLVSE
ncbi:MAG: hypothetical protein K8T91_15645 [Planctomycetes bacterium]|nr:hypothetical protein [Planctomycetota bacterium]